MTATLHRGDLPPDVNFGASVAIDSETMGLNPHRDRLCVVQLSGGDGTSHVVHFQPGDYAAPNLKKLLADPKVLKIFHFGVLTAPVYCTKIASKLVRTFTDRHGLKDICKELLDIDLSKQQQSSDWGADTLTPEQVKYAASDVLYLHRLKEKLDVMLVREGRSGIAQACFDFLPTRAGLDLAGWPEVDIFEH